MTQRRIDAWMCLNIDSGMKARSIIFLFSIAFLAALGLYLWVRTTEPRLYVADDLIGLDCAELGRKHDEVITAFHDAAIAQHKRTGAFPDDLGLPRTEDLPVVVLITRFLQDHGLTGFDFAKPHALSTSGPESDVFTEVSGLCAASPSLDAMAAVTQAAKQLDLIE